MFLILLTIILLLIAIAVRSHNRIAATKPTGFIKATIVSDKSETYRPDIWRDIERSVDALPESDGIEKLDLEIEIDGAFKKPVETRSSSDSSVVYIVDLENQTCTCPDWCARSDQPKNHLGRYCKHLIGEFRAASSLPKDEWIEWLMSYRGGPIRAWWIHLKTAPSVLLTCGIGSPWVNIHARTKRKGERIANATGSIEQTGWNVIEQRWSYGQGPIGSRELTPIMRKLVIQKIARDTNERGSGNL